MSKKDNDVFYILLTLVAGQNRNHLPRTVAEWQEVAARFGVELYVVPARSHRTGVLLEDVIVIAETPDRRELQSRIAHELAEYLLVSEWEAPYVYPCGDIVKARHELSRLFERRISRLFLSSRH